MQQCGGFQPCSSEVPSKPTADTQMGRMWWGGIYRNKGNEKARLLRKAASFFVSVLLAFLCSVFHSKRNDHDSQCSGLERRKRCGSKKKRGSHCIAMTSSLAAGEGFEPSQTESESGVLPLHKPAVFRRTLIIISHFRKMSIGNLKFFQKSCFGQWKRTRCLSTLS